MNFKTSFFNKSIIKSDFKRFWWIGALNTLLVLIFFTAIYIERIVDGGNFYSGDNGELFLNMGSQVIFLIFIIPVMLAALIFSYINSSSAVSCMHGLPIKRKTFFASHMLSGAVILILPIVINVIIFLFCRLNHYIAQSFAISQLFMWAGVYVVYNLMIFAFSSMIMMFIGNTVAGIVFSYIFAALPIVTEISLKLFLGQHLFGFSPSEDLLSTFLYSSPETLYSNPLNILKYVVFAVIFTILAYFIYKKRNLEHTAEIVAFPKLRSVFVYCCGIYTGIAGYAYLCSLLQINRILFLIPFGIIGIIIAQMIAQKTLRPKKFIKSLVIFSLSVCVIQLAFSVDLFGYERRIPNPDEVESVSFSNGVDNLREIGYTNTGDKIIFSGEHSNSDLTAPEDIENVTLLHKVLVENRDFKQKNPFYATITYHLKNGRKISRQYLADYVVFKNQLEPIIETKEMRKVYFPILDEKLQRNYFEIVLSDTRIISTGHDFSFNADSEEFDKILNALKADTKTTDYLNFADRRSTFTTIIINYSQPATYENGKKVDESLLPIFSETYYVRSDYKNTLDVINQLHFFDQLPTADDIAVISFNKPYSSEFPATESAESYTDYQIKNSVFSFSIATENPEEIAEIYEYIEKNAFNLNLRDNYDKYVYTEIVLKDALVFGLYIDPDEENLPDILKKYCN